MDFANGQNSLAPETVCAASSMAGLLTYDAAFLQAGEKRLLRPYRPNGIMLSYVNHSSGSCSGFAPDSL